MPTARPISEDHGYHKDASGGSIAVRSLGPILGAEIIGADVSRHVSDGDMQTFRDALHQYKVLCFRDQDLGKEQLIAFSKQWGSLGEHIMPGATRAGVPEINVLSNATPEGKPSGKHPDPTAKRWHTDRSYMPRPAMASLLYGVEVPSVGGDTLFANTTMAYEALPEETRNRIDKLNAIHWVVHSRRDGGVAEATEEEKRKAPPIRHPLARPHPATGKKAIYAGCHAWMIEGLDEIESRRLIDDLTAFAVQDRFVYAHKWRRHDLVMWDNRCTFHAATDYDTAKELRIMYRTVVEGDATVPV
jgi:alpha-ketoglutarate-dependent taurine dioxygenase